MNAEVLSKLRPFYYIITPDDSRLLDAVERLDPHPNQEFSWGSKIEAIDQLRYWNCEMNPSYLYWIREYMKKIDIGLQLEISDIWQTTYKRGSFQESHDHPECDLVSVIFLDDSGTSGRFYFKNYNGEETHFVDYKKGDMIVFPSNLVHGVTPFITSIWEDLILRKRRRTISINADIIDYCPWEMSMEKTLYEEALEHKGRTG